MKGTIGLLMIVSGVFVIYLIMTGRLGGAVETATPGQIKLPHNDTQTIIPTTPSPGNLTPLASGGYGAGGDDRVYTRYGMVSTRQNNGNMPIAHWKGLAS